MAPFIFLSVFLAVIIYLLFIPVTLFIDTVNNTYYLELKGVAKASITSDPKELLKIKLKVFFLNFYFYPLKKRLNKKKKATVTTKSSKKKKPGFFKIKTALRMLRSFQIKKCNLNIDTGDCIQNAKLYPLFGFLNMTKGTFRINFEGENSILLCVENRPIRLIKSLINI